jgi:hypothetical protein
MRFFHLAMFGVCASPASAAPLAVLAGGLVIAGWAPAALAQAVKSTPKADCSTGARPTPAFSLFFDPNGVWPPYQVANPCLPGALTDALQAVGVARYRPLSATAVNTIQYDATGSFTPPGSVKPLTLTQSRMQIGYAIPAFRFDYEGGGRRRIDVWSYKYAWNETTPGAGAAPAMDQMDSRIPLIWLTPQGALWAGVYADSKTKVSTSGARTVLTAPVAQLGIVSITTLGADHLPEKTVLKYKGKVYEAAFADYQSDQPNYLNKFPAKMLWKVDGKEFGNFTITNFRANPYVVFPAPANVRQAANPSASADKYVYAPAFLPSAAEGFNASIKPEGETPRTKGGKVDLTGYWSKGGPPISIDLGRSLLIPDRPLLQSRRNDMNLVVPDRTMLTRGRLNKPIYKPEYWSRIQALDFGKLWDDPYFTGKPLGTPRNGMPTFIAMTDDWLMMKYYNLDSVRVIPLTGREHTEDDVDYGNTYNGIGIGHWDGDTLIVDSVGFNDISWLYWTGYAHSANMRVVEKFRRVGDVLYYDATVYDDMLAQPWVLDTQVRRLNPDKADTPREFPPWIERDKDNTDPDYRG